MTYKPRNRVSLIPIPVPWAMQIVAAHYMAHAAQACKGT